MSADPKDRLAKMANEIAAFFATQPAAEALPGMVQHLRDFWTPKMRADFLELAAAGGRELSPLASKAAAALRPSTAGKR
ncbi:MAG: formate dehydrogenase subunit delta [Hyphomicrobiales bacterium]|nr:formate dehydrogenase subunit delta [Hyphomicrobiales bacterium]